MENDNLKHTFDDFLIEPSFSNITSRKDVQLNRIPVISSNMSTVTGFQMAEAMQRHGAYAALPRFMSIEDNVALFKQTPDSFVSVGLGENELLRAASLLEAGAKTIIIDVAHGAQRAVVDQATKIRNLSASVNLIVGNFASGTSVVQFFERVGAGVVDGIKVGIGSGSICSTRLVTGVGMPQASALIECKNALNTLGLINVQIISDGGIRNPGDVAKALALGADLVMIGGLFSGTDETPGELNTERMTKVYRGSASYNSYKEQGKLSNWRATEGVEFEVAAKGPVSKVLQQIEGGLRSTFTYVGARNLKEFKNVVKLNLVSPLSRAETGVGEVKL